MCARCLGVVDDVDVGVACSFLEVANESMDSCGSNHIAYCQKRHHNHLGSHYHGSCYGSWQIYVVVSI